MPNAWPPINSTAIRVGAELSVTYAGNSIIPNVHVINPTPSNANGCDISGHWRIKYLQLFWISRFLKSIQLKFSSKTHKHRKQQQTHMAHFFFGVCGSAYHFGPLYSNFCSSSAGTCGRCDSSKSTDGINSLMFTTKKHEFKTIKTVKNCKNKNMNKIQKLQPKNINYKIAYGFEPFLCVIAMISFRISFPVVSFVLWKQRDIDSFVLDCKSTG